MDGESSLDELFRDDINPHDLPPCDLEHLDEILMIIKTPHPTVRSTVLIALADKDGAYIVKLLDLFDVSELDADKTVLHKLFDIFYAMLEMCNRELIKILLSETNFISVIGVFGYNPGLICEMDFRTVLEGDGGFIEVIPITDPSVVERVHMNFRIQVIKDNVLVRLLPDSCVLLLEHMVNENNFHILTFILETKTYWKTIKELVASNIKRSEGLGLLKAIINMVRVTKSLSKPQRRDAFGAPPVFGTLISNLFGDGELFATFASILGSSDSEAEDITLAVDILTELIVCQSPDKLRSYLASEGKCIPAPASDKDRISWTPESSLFTALLVVFERDEPLRIQLINLLREVFRVPLGQDDKFLSVLYPNYMHWMLQPMKNNTFIHNASAMFDLQDSIMELLTFCTENHGYRVKYLFGRQPVATYAVKMLRSRNKLFVMHAVKFVRACAVRAEAFFSRFLIQNDLFTPMLENLEIGKPNTGAVSSAILEVLSFVEKTNLTSLVEHIYTKFYETYKAECPLVFEAIRSRHNENTGFAGTDVNISQASKIQFVRAACIDDEEELYFDKDTENNEPSPALSKTNLLDEEVSCLNRPRSVKLVNYNDDDENESEDEDDDDDDGQSFTKEKDDSETLAVTSPRGAEIEDDRIFQPPVHKKKEEEVDAESFLMGSNFIARKKAQQAGKNVRSPHFKNVFQKISWKLGTPIRSKDGDDGNSPPVLITEMADGNNISDTVKRKDSSEGSDNATELEGETVENNFVAKRKLAMEDAAESEPLLKKAKTCNPISSS
ncbi:Protein predicted to be involved in carbohydrate metabolism [Plasmopara halstedii]|uniref:Protein predicted to be involved in carbohydrate metabolism n=1 Tax=Plasmopara halstedii TaxID=4781 RepID=A0A0P1ACS2_PLAHL|nr:Protein predicted to be involved in carbohydrate metabolism [Plasmopara halstedii]CEG38778.1 Protein predicted to be involved in carbohydrate metabolism [Plasmopara halstedii]|eukprot:XP_024575147.1 Protein predicted to be involved in carbohydrate metabolism [Plasmopara halstedii]